MSQVNHVPDQEEAGQSLPLVEVPIQGTSRQSTESSRNDEVNLENSQHQTQPATREECHQELEPTRPQPSTESRKAPSLRHSTSTESRSLTGPRKFMLSRPASQRGDEEIREEDDQHDPPGEYARGSVQSMYLDEFFHLADCLGEGDEKPLQEVLQFGIDGIGRQSSLDRTANHVDETDPCSRYQEDVVAEHVQKLPLEQNSHFTALGLDDDEDLIVSWEEQDVENPYNWSSGKKTGVLLTAVMLIVNSTMGSALPSMAIPYIAEEWNVTALEQKVLPISVYLIGYVMGPVLWAPLSEQYGRKKLTIATFSMFALFTLACALAPTWISFLIFRLFAGVFASAPIAMVPGIIADIFGDPRARGRAMGLFMATTVFGPLIAPIISGYTAPVMSWRWAFWIGLMYAGLTMLALLFLPETFGPVLLLHRARKIRKTDPDARVVAPHELEKKSVTELTTVVLTRPIRMIIFEPIVSCSCAYLSLCYGIFYMTFEAYPIIFLDLYGLSPGMCGLMYLAIGAGCLLALPIFVIWDGILTRARERDAPWTHQEEYRRLPLACIGGPMFVISLFWLGWTSREEIPYYVPMLAGIPFGIGFMCIFQALLNYLTDAYEIFAASANAAASTSRSLLATVLPLATIPMFSRLGIAASCSLLGGVSLLMCAVPFVFLWQGERIRAGSKFCAALRRRKEDMARRIEDQRRRRTGIIDSTYLQAAASTEHRDSAVKMSTSCADSSAGSSSITRLHPGGGGGVVAGHRTCEQVRDGEARPGTAVPGVGNGVGLAPVGEMAERDVRANKEEMV